MSNETKTTPAQRIREWAAEHKLVLCDSDGTVVRDVDPSEAMILAHACDMAGRGYIKHVPKEDFANAR